MRKGRKVSFHHQTLSVDGNGNRTTNTYDTTTGDLLTTTDALNEVTTYAYYQSGGRSNGLVQSITDSLNHITSFAYQCRSRQELYDTRGHLLQFEQFLYKPIVVPVGDFSGLVVGEAVER
jgi:YD repeat-containing protein